MGRIIRLSSERLDGSEISSVPPHEVGLSEAVLAENIDPRDLRGATTRNGRQQHGVTLSSASDSYGVKAWTRDAGTTFVITRIGTTFYDASAASWASLGIGGTAQEVFRAEPLNNILAIVVDGLAPKQFSGGVLSNLGAAAPSEARYAAIFSSKLFLAGDDANPQTKYFSATNDPTQFDASLAPDDAGSITTQEGGGDTIQGLTSNNKVLLTFYRNHVDVLLGTSTFDFREERLINKGLVSKTGYYSVGEYAFFASDDAVYMVSGTTVSDITSQRFRKTYKDISDKSKISIVASGDLLLVADYGTGRGYLCAYKYGRWSEWTDQDWRAMDIGIDQTIYAVPASIGSMGKVLKLDVGSTDLLTLGTAGTITAAWRTANWGFGWNDCPKNLRALRLHAKPGIGTVTVQWYKNGASYGSTNSLAFGTAGDHDIAGVAGQPGLRGHFIGFKASWQGPGTLYGFALYGEVVSDEGQIPPTD